MSALIECLDNGRVQLSVYECGCGFHIGIDSSFLEQVEELSVTCPSCGERITTAEGDEKEFIRLEKLKEMQKEEQRWQF